MSCNDENSMLRGKFADVTGVPLAEAWALPTAQPKLTWLVGSAQ
jgi:hypothetical protein